MTAPDFTADQLAAADHLLATTRAVRKRFDLDRPVDRQVVLDCIDLAQQAPTGSNAQGWRFVVVTDPDKRAALAEIYRAGAGSYFDDGAARARDDQARRVVESARHLADNLHRVPVHVLPCVYSGSAQPPSDLASAAGLFGSILPAAWSFMLALRARGLGSVWTTLHLNRAADAAALLGIPPTVMQTSLIPVGYYTGETFKRVARRPAAEITYWDGWKQPG